MGVENQGRIRVVPRRGISGVLWALALWLPVLPAIGSDTLGLQGGLQNVFVTPEVGGAMLHWSVEQPYVKGHVVLVRYGTRVAVSHDGEWEYLEPIQAEPIQSQRIEGLGQEEDHIFQIVLVPDYMVDGLSPPEVGRRVDVSGASWYQGGFITQRGWGVLRVFMLIGALGLFIYGMKVMSEGLQQAAGAKLRRMLANITSNRVKGVLTGMGITATIQSSSVTTVMTVSFVNAGLLTLVQSAGVMMGANVGTTVTAWLISIFGFKVDVASYSLVVIALALPLMFFTRSKLRSWALAMIGFAILFMGLGMLKDQVPTLGSDSSLVSFFSDYADIPILSTVIFVLLGALVTIIIQSSSAALALTMTLVQAGVIPFEVACAMVLGENIGTTITAELAATIGNVYAKRSARIHSLFNIIGVTWMVLAFPLFVSLVGLLVESTGRPNPVYNVSTTNSGLALFHTVFNFSNLMILIWFVPWIVRLAERSVKAGREGESKLRYMGTRVGRTPELSLGEAKKELEFFGDIVGRMCAFTQELLMSDDNRTRERLRTRLVKYEAITDRLEMDIGTYLSRVAKGSMTAGTADRIRAMNSMISDLERVGDLFYQMTMVLEKKDEEGVELQPSQREALMGMFTLLDESILVMNANLKERWGEVSAEQARELDRKVAKQREVMRKQHFEAMKSAEYHRRAGLFYMDLFSNCVKVSDHVVKVTEAIVEHQ